MTNIAGPVAISYDIVSTNFDSHIFSISCLQNHLLGFGCKYWGCKSSIGTIILCRWTRWREGWNKFYSEGNCYHKRAQSYLSKWACSHSEGKELFCCWACFPRWNSFQLHTAIDLRKCNRHVFSLWEQFTLQHFKTNPELGFSIPRTLLSCLMDASTLSILMITIFNFIF